MFDILKVFCRRILPAKFVSGYRAIKDRWRLYKVKKKNFDIDNLAGVSPDSFKMVFCGMPHKEWHEVVNIISMFDLPREVGEVSPADRKALFLLLRFFNVSSVLEIGTHIGSSTIAMALAVVRSSKGDHLKYLDTVDVIDVNSSVCSHWKKYGALMSPIEMMKAAGVDEYVYFHKTSSEAFFKEDGRKYDLIFIDGDHSASAVYSEIYYALGRLNAHGLIVLHDYYPELRNVRMTGKVITGPWYAVERLKTEVNGLTVIPFSEAGDLVPELSTSTMALLCKQSKKGKQKKVPRSFKIFKLNTIKPLNLILSFKLGVALWNCRSDFTFCSLKGS